MYLYLGGSISGLALMRFTDYYFIVYRNLQEKLIETPTVYDLSSYIMLPLILLYITPIFLSLVLTRINPEKRIIPPLYMQIIAVVWFLMLRFEKTEIITLALLFAYIYLASPTQDKIATSLYGISTHRDDVYGYSLRLKTTPKKTRDILLNKRFRGTIGLQKDPEENDRGIILKSPKNDIYQIFIQLESDSDNETLVNMVFFEKGKYNIKITEDLVEFTQSKIAYIENVFSRDDYQLELQKESSLTHVQPLIDFVIDEMQGISPHIVGRPFASYFKLTAFIFALLISIYFIFEWESIEGWAILAMILLYLAFELPDKLRQR